MARDDEKHTLELHIKVNGQNLSAISEKCNIGTLRLPTDPSWPKIPLRRLTDNTNDVIEPPCIVTLTGTPRKGRSIVRTITCQHTKPRLSQKYEVPTHIPKRLPGYIDPRFKRQILRQKAEKPDESCNMKNDKQMPELDTYVLQETKKPEDKSQETREIVDDYMPPHHDVNKFSNVTKSAQETIDYSIKKQSVLETNHYTMASQYATNERYNTEDRFSQEQKRDSNRSLFLMIDEKKVHTLPINTLNIEVTPSSAQSLQCYSVQIPVIAYHNVPLQISNIPTQMQKDIKIPYECQNDSAKDRETVGNNHVTSTLTNSTYNSKDSQDEKCILNSIYQCNPTSNNDISENKNISHCDGHTFDWIRDKENVNSNISLNQDIINETSLSKDCNFSVVTDNMDDAKNENSSNLNTTRKLKNNAKQGYNTGSCIANGCNDRKKSNGRKITKISVHPCKSVQKQKFAYRVKDGQIKIDKYPTNMTNDKIQVLAFSDGVGDKKHDETNNEIKKKHEKLRTSVKCKATSINLSKKAKSFFRKKSHLAITNSDYTLILPGPRRIKGKQYEKTRGCSKANQLLRRSGINSTNSIRIKSKASKEDRINSCSLMNLQAGNLFEKPLPIPLETQELLNKSYWEYYWKLNRKVASAKSDNVGRKDKHPNKRDCLPESQTLQQCSVLSCMINTALRDSMTAERSLNPTASIMPNTCGNIYEASGLSSVFVKKVKRKKMKRATSKRSLGLKTIVLNFTGLHKPGFKPPCTNIQTRDMRPMLNPEVEDANGAYEACRNHHMYKRIMNNDYATCFLFENKILLAILSITMYVAVIFLPMIYDYIVDEEYDDDYENTHYIGLTLQYIASSFGEVFDGIVNILNAIFLRPVRFDRKL